MDVEILHTERCILRPVTAEDADWLFDLFNDCDVVKYIEGIKWFNADVDSVRTFIESMHINADKDLGAMWCVEYQSANIGFILAYDLKDNPFLSFALFPKYRSQHLGSEVIAVTKEYISRRFQSPVIESNNPIVKEITRKLPVVLYLGDTFFQSLQSFREVIEKLNLRNKQDLDTLDNVIALLRDGVLLSWLEYLSETGDGDAFDIASAIRSIPADTREKELKRQILNLFKSSSSANWPEEQTVPVKLSDNAEIDFGEGAVDFNIHLPINTNKNSQEAKLTLHFEITDISNDMLRLSIGDDIHELSLKRRKKQGMVFNVLLKDTIEQEVVLNIDGTPFHKFIIQSYPSSDWSDDDCISHGIRDLYLQDYTKARLCFERVHSSAGSFLLGLMHYIGALGSLDATKSLYFFKKAKDKKDGKWSKMANALMAVMALKGEGHTMDNFTGFDADFLPDGHGGEFIRKAIQG
ncbi:MAG: GNAT family N-acetyltransferase, partial [Muribaculaceae bacterium]|nr:GNAT family N-acetyltransferase [Muribaculaceae bacterium]